jgi:RIO-like serine/threonine protein kinase
MLLDDSIEIDGVTYKIFAEIGEGTSGTVYTVTNPKGRKFAMKVINDYGRNPILREMINR